MKRRSVLPPTTSASSTSTSGSTTASRSSMSDWILLIDSLLKRKEVGQCPLPRRPRPRRPAYRKLQDEDSTGMSELQRATAAIVDRYLAALEGETRRVADQEWGLTVDAAEWPLHVGVAIRDGLLRAQAQVADPGALDPEALLRWNRQVPLVGFGLTRSGEVWLGGDLPLPAVDAKQ